MRAREAVIGAAGLVIGAIAGTALVAGRSPGGEPVPGAAASVTTAAPAGGPAESAALTSQSAAARAAPAGGGEMSGRNDSPTSARRPPDPASGLGRRFRPTRAPSPPPDADPPADAHAAAPEPPPPAPPPILSFTDILAMCEGEDVGRNDVYRCFRAWDRAARWDLARDLAAGRTPDLLASPLALDCFVSALSSSFDDAKDGASAGVLPALERRIAGVADPESRVVAVDVARLCGPAGLGFVAELAASDPSPHVRAQALDAFDTWDDSFTDAARRVILDCAESDDGEVRWAAVELLPMTGVAGGAVALRLLRDGALPDDLLRAVAVSVTLADAIPDALEHRRDLEFASALADSVATAIDDGATSRRWFPSIFTVPLFDPVLDRLMDQIVKSFGTAEVALIALDARCLPAARLRAFTSWAEDAAARPDAVTAALRAVRDPAVPALMRRELPSRIVEWLPEADDEGATARPEVRAESLRALRDAAARETNPWVRDAIRAALAGAE